jgi:CheY-like chemotaxis protein
MRRVLVVEDNELERLGITTLIKDESMQVLAVGTAAEALAALMERPYDVVVLDLKLPDLPGIELLRQLTVMPNFHNVPVVVYTGIDLKPEDEKELARFGELIIKKTTSSPALLLAEIRKCLSMPQDSAAAVEPSRSTNGASGVLAGKKVLTVDDDYRNVFALAAVLEKEGVEVLPAGSGQEAINQLKEVPAIDLVLLDIMMPAMDGYETMRRIRAIDLFRSLPIIALTAKAMQGDREKCLEAGASDYVPKPVDPDRLLTIIRRWV